MGHLPRHEQIINILSRMRSVTISELRERLDVSEVTLRKDLTFLEEIGALVRTRGGASLAEDGARHKTLHIREKEQLLEKSGIVRKALDLIKDGDTIYLDSGSTCVLLARSLLRMNIRVVTNSIMVMNQLADAPGISLFSIGGSYRKDAGSFLGPIAVETLKNFQFESCFMGATGFNNRGIFSSQNIIESQLKNQVLQVSKRRIILADSSKQNKNAFSVFARTGEVDVLISDNHLAESGKLRALGIEVILTEADMEEK